MKINKINSTEDALRLFEESIVKRGVAFDADDFKTYNKYLPIIYKCMEYLYKNKQLDLLYKYLSHENQHVRSTTAYALFPLYEKDCIKVLQEIVNGNYGLLCLNAKTTLMMWYDGDLKYPFLPGYGKKSCDNTYESSDRQTEVVMEKEESKEYLPIIMQLSQLFDCPPANDQELRNEDMGYYVRCNTEKKEIEIRINTFVNPYTQDIETVYKERVARFRAFEDALLVSLDKPSKLGFMQIRLTISEEKASADLLLRIKEILNEIYGEWKPYESTVCFKVDYNGAICCFEGVWWCPTRAVIKNRKEYERYDFSDEMKYDEEMWDIVQGEYDNFEFSDTFELITLKEFQHIWTTTERLHKPEPF